MPRTISTSGILSTGEKKCRPTKLVGSGSASAIEVIGSDEVFEASRASGPTIAGDLGERLPLEVEVLEDRLDDHVAAGQRGQVVGRR